MLSWRSTAFVVAIALSPPNGPGCSSGHSDGPYPWAVIHQSLSEAESNVLYVEQDGSFGGNYVRQHVPGVLAAEELIALRAALEPGLWQQYKDDALSEKAVGNAGDLCVRAGWGSPMSLFVCFAPSQQDVSPKSRELVEVAGAIVDNHDPAK